MIKSWRARLSVKIINRTNLLLMALGCAALVLYRVSLKATGGDDIRWFIIIALCQSAIYLAAAWITFRARHARSTLILVIIFAALFRLSILFAPPYLSDDIYRYIWDGRVQASGISPYRYVPADETISHLRDETIYPHINRRDYAVTIYPPVAQMIYFLVTRVSERVTWMKIVMVGFEALTIWALMLLLASFNLPRERVLIYAWHPLLVWELAGSGHIEAAFIALMCLALLARRRRWETTIGVALAGATLIKFFPVILFPALYRRWGWKMPAAFALTIIVAYLPYLSVGLTRVLGFLPGYTKEEGIQNGERFYLLSLVRRAFGEAYAPNIAYLIFAVIALGAIALWTIWKTEDDDSSYLKHAFIVAATFTVLLSPRYAWYFAWLVPFTCFVPLVPVFYLTTACFILYRLWREEGTDQLIILNTIVYLPFALLGLITFFKRFAGRDRAGELADLLEREST